MLAYSLEIYHNKTSSAVCFEDFDKILRTRYNISRTILSTRFGSWFVLIVKMFLEERFDKLLLLFNWFDLPEIKPGDY